MLAKAQPNRQIGETAGARAFTVLAVLGLLSALPGAQAPEPDRRTSVNGVELASVERGDGAAVFLVHGSGADLRTWGHQMEPIASSFRAIAYSRRYHHPNPPPAVDAPAYTAGLHAADLAAFIRTRGTAPAHVVASSYGGAVALLVARDEPELVRSLVLTEPALLGLLPPGSAEAQDAARLDAARGLLVRGQAAAALQGFVDVVIGPGAWLLAPPSTRQMLRDNLPELRMEAVAPRGDPAFSCEDAARVRAPVLLLDGDASPAFFRAIAARLAQCLPHVEPVTVAGAAHAVHAQQPARFNELVLAFLKRQPA